MKTEKPSKVKRTKKFKEPDIVELALSKLKERIRVQREHLEHLEHPTE